MDFDPELWLRIRNKKVTQHQMEILAELASSHSQTQSAAKLGISVPVLHRHIKSLSSKLGGQLVFTTPNGTWVSEEGKLLLKIYQRYQDMMKAPENISIYCTPITYDLVRRTVLEFELQDKDYRISLNHDQQNLKALYLGRADLVIFDDPIYAMEFEGLKEEKVITNDLFYDSLIHFDNGPDYLRFKYGAQRLGFRYLDSKGINYNVLHEVGDPDYIKNSNKSYFINLSMLKNKGWGSSNIETLATVGSEMFKHPIMAVSINPNEEIRTIVNGLKNRAVGFV